MTSASGPERKFWQIALADLDRQLGASPNGLGSAEAAARRIPPGGLVAQGICLARANTATGGAGAWLAGGRLPKPWGRVRT